MLGGFDVLVDGVAVPAGGWRLNKARSLLKLLALAEGNRMHRDAVVEALWPDLTAVAGANNLHQALHAARRALAEAGASAGVLRLRDGVVALCPDGGLATDVQALETALDKALAADAPELLLDIATQCSQGLLPEDSYEDWAHPYRGTSHRRSASHGGAPAARHLIAKGSEHRRTTQTGDVILVGMSPVLVAVLGQQSLGTLRGDIEQQFRGICSQGLVECCFEGLDVGGQAARQGTAQQRVSQPKNTSRGAGLSQRTTSCMQCLMRIVGACNSCSGLARAPQRGHRGACGCLRRRPALSAASVPY